MNMEKMVAALAAGVRTMASENRGQEIEAEMTSPPFVLDDQEVQLVLRVTIAPVGAKRTGRVAGLVEAVAA